MRGKIGLMVFMILIVLPLALAEQSAKTDYNESGNFDNRYELGLGAFNSNLDPADVNAQTTTVLVTDGRKVPLISDLDGDGLTEVIILDGRNIEVYQNKTLSLVDSFTLDTATDERFSNILTFDINGDGLREIIIMAEEEEELHILQLNNSVLTNITRSTGIDFSLWGHTAGTNAGEIVIKCSSTERCLALFSDNIRTGNSGGGVTNKLIGCYFNSSQEAIQGDGDKLCLNPIDSSSSLSVFCQPNIRHMTAIDYDEDNGGASADPSEFEFIASNLEVEQSLATDELLNIYWIDILPNSSVVLENSIQNTVPGSILGGATTGVSFSCDNSVGQNENNDGTGNPLFPGFYVTSPLVFDADPTSGFETVVGIGVDPDEFNILMFEKDGSFLDDFPEVADSEGIMISNVFKADIFDDSTQDFCVMGFNGDPTGGVDDSLSVTCGSKNDPNGFGLTNFETIEFRFDKQGLFNISQTYDNAGVLAHSGEHDTSNDIDEVVSAYGILELDRTCTITGNCDMDLIFQQPKGSNNPRIITTDAYDRVGLEDMIVLTDVNLFYMDDGFTNQPATITNIFTNPCLDSVWKINSSVEVKITATDPENDLVSVRATLYSGDTNEQSREFINASSGTEVPFSFIANKTIGGGSLLFEAFDPVNNPNDIDSIDKAFSVAQTGVEFNDCTTSESFVTEAEAEEAILNASLTVDATENAVESGIDTLTGISGLAGTTIWLILMLAFSLFIWFEIAQTGMSGNSGLGVIAIVNALFIILGARLGILSTGLVVIIVLLAVVIVAVFLGKFLTGISATGGNGGA